MADRWEYKTLTVDHRSNEIADRHLTDFGNEGWELVAVTRFSFETIAYFKRPVRAALQEAVR